MVMHDKAQVFNHIPNRLYALQLLKDGSKRRSKYC